MGIHKTKTVWFILNLSYIVKEFLRFWPSVQKASESVGISDPINKFNNNYDYYFSLLVIIITTT